MNTQLPTPKEIEKLVSFLPRLYEGGLTPIKKWEGGTKGEDGVITLGWPEYEKVVAEFFQVASDESWRDHDYVPNNAARMLEDEDFIKTADLAQITTMLTFCVRGERLCDGHWSAMIEEGHIRRLLQRLAEL